MPGDTEPCLVGGDFNVVQVNEEKVGRLFSDRRPKKEFNQCI